MPCRTYLTDFRGNKSLCIRTIINDPLNFKIIFVTSYNHTANMDLNHVHGNLVKPAVVKQVFNSVKIGPYLQWAFNWFLRQQPSCAESRFDSGSDE